MHSSYSTGVKEVTPAALEVLEEEEAGWKPLPSPPFSEAVYSAGTYSRIAKHVVVGNCIYVVVFLSDSSCNYYLLPRGRFVVYSFDTVSREWKEHSTPRYYDEEKNDDDEQKKDLIATHLIRCYWDERVDVVNNLMYNSFIHFIGCTTPVFAFDLGCSLDDDAYPDLGKGCPLCEDYDADYEGRISFVADDPDDSDLDNVATWPILKLPIHGLSHVTSKSQYKGHQTVGFMMHLRDNLFCSAGIAKGERGTSDFLYALSYTVHSEPPPADADAGAAFKDPPVSSGRCLHARVFKDYVFPKPLKVGSIQEWCKLPAIDSASDTVDCSIVKLAP